MKKVFAICALALFAVSFSSCKKDYTCTCTATESITGISASESTTLTATLADAEEACDAGDSVDATVTTECELD